MSIAAHIAKHLRNVHFGGNWTVSAYQEHLADVTWQQATTQVHSCNTIATLVFHTHYFVGVATRVLQGGPLQGNDKESFDHPPILSQQDWDRMREQFFADAEIFAALIEQVPDEQMWSDFGDGKYGNYYTNLQGIVEHFHYHLGQIVVIKKLLNSQAQ